MKRPINPMLSWPLNSKEQHTCIKYANNLLEYSNYFKAKCDQLEKELEEFQTIKKEFAEFYGSLLESANNDVERFEEWGDGLAKELKALKDAIKESEQARMWYKEVGTQETYDKYEKKLKILQTLIK